MVGLNMELLKKAYIRTCWLPLCLILILPFLPVNWGHGGAWPYLAAVLILSVIFLVSGFFLIAHGFNRGQNQKGLYWAFWISTSPFWGLVLAGVFKKII